MKKSLQLPQEAERNIALWRGRIIVAAIVVEHQMDFIISKYLNPEKRNEFYELILLETSWERKIQMLSQITKDKALKVNKLIDELREIKTLRNKAAHWKHLFTYDNDLLKTKEFDLLKSGKQLSKIKESDVTEYEHKCNEMKKRLLQLSIKLKPKTSKK